MKNFALVLLLSLISCTSIELPDEVRLQVFKTTCEKVKRDYGTTECKDGRCEQKGYQSEFNFCIHQPTESKSKDILYYMHGFGDSHTAWVDSQFPESFVHFKRMHMLFGDVHPTVVTISYGNSWILTPELKDKDKHPKRDKPPQDANIETFRDLVLGLERRFELNGDRFILGYSMGGFNTIQLISNPLTKSMFKKVVLVNAMLPICCVPFECGNPACWIIAGKIFEGAPVVIIESNFQGKEHYEPNNPFGALSVNLDDKTPPVHYQSALDDDWRFFVRAPEWTELAKSRGVDVTLIEHKGSHNYLNPVKIVEFLVGVEVGFWSWLKGMFST